MGELEGEHAREHVDADVVLGPVEHRAEGGDAGVFHLPEGCLGLGLGPVTGDHPGGGPVVVVGDQHVLAEDLLLQGSAGARVDAPGELVVFGGVSGQLPGDNAACPGVVQDLADLGFHLRPAPPGLAAGEGRGQLVQHPACLRQGGAGEPGCLGGVQLRRVGQDGAALGPVDLAAGVAGGQPPEAVLIDDGAGAGGQPGQAGAVGHRPDVMQARPGEVGEVGGRVLADVEHYGHVCGDLAAGANRLVPAGERIDHGRDWVTSGLSPGQACQVSGMPPSWVTTRPRPTRRRSVRLMLGLAALGDRGAFVAGIDEGGEVGHVRGDGGAVHAGRIADRQRDPAGDLLQLLQADGTASRPRTGGDPVPAH